VQTRRETRIAPRRTALTRAAITVVLVGMCSLAVFSAGCTKRVAQEPLAPSQPAEQTLRSMRLIGVDRAAVGENGRTVTLRLEVPAISSAGDVEIAWQSAMGVLTESYPKARSYVVRLAGSDGVPLVEFAAQGRAARKAVADADLAALRRAMAVSYLVAGEPAMPSGSVAISPIGGLSGDALSAAYLDAKNRAVFTRGVRERPPVFARVGSPEAAKTREAVPGRPALAVDQDPNVRLSELLVELIVRPTAKEIAGVGELRALAESTTAPGPERILNLRRWVAVAEATVAEQPFGDVAWVGASTARAVGSTKLLPASAYFDGQRAKAVLVAAQSPDAPDAMKQVRRFLRAERWDVTFDPGRVGLSVESSVPGATDEQLATIAALKARLALNSRGDGRTPVVSWETSAGVQSASPSGWLAFRRNDGRVFWLLAENAPAAISSATTALTDASLDGWAWSARRVDVVDAADVGHVLSTIELR
jgi:hypothetical protein